MSWATLRISSRRLRTRNLICSDILAIMGSSIPSESVFSESGIVGSFQPNQAFRREHTHHDKAATLIALDQRDELKEFNERNSLDCSCSYWNVLLSVNVALMRSIDTQAANLIGHPIV